MFQFVPEYEEPCQAGSQLIALAATGRSGVSDRTGSGGRRLVAGADTGQTIALVIAHTDTIDTIVGI